MATIVRKEWKKMEEGKEGTKMDYAGYTNEPHLRFFNADALQHSRYEF